MSDRGRTLPEPGTPAGYAALIAEYDLRVPPPSRLAAIANRHHPDSTRHWRMFAPSYAPEDSLADHLEFAVKWEGVSLAVLRALFRRVGPAEIVHMVRDKPTGKYTRRIMVPLRMADGPAVGTSGLRQGDGRSGGGSGPAVRPRERAALATPPSPEQSSGYAAVLSDGAPDPRTRPLRAHAAGCASSADRRTDPP